MKKSMNLSSTHRDFAGKSNQNMHLEMTKVYDSNFNESGFTQEDFVHSLKLLNLREDAEFTAIEEGFKQQLQAFIEEKKAESEAHRKAEEESKSAAAQ